MNHSDYGLSRSEYIAALRDDARFYRTNAAALRKQAEHDEDAAREADEKANRLEGETQTEPRQASNPQSPPGGAAAPVRAVDGPHSSTGEKP